MIFFSFMQLNDGHRVKTFLQNSLDGDQKGIVQSTGKQKFAEGHFAQILSYYVYITIFFSVTMVVIV